MLLGDNFGLLLVILSGSGGTRKFMMVIFKDHYMLKILT